MTTSSIRIGPAELAVLALAAATAIIHIALALPTNLVMFYLNGLGYLALATALYLPQLGAYRRWTRYALIAFTAVTVLGWAAFGERSLLAIVDKAIELALIGLLVREARLDK